MQGLDDLEALRALDEPTRRRLYELVVASGRPVGRDEAARAVGIGRTLAAYHLDRLVSHGLLVAERTRRGVGRPPTLYRRAEREFSLGVPPRDYRLLAELLAAGDPPAAAHELGRRLAAGGGTAEELLRAGGYEPFEVEPGLVRLRNCPFAAVAARSPDVVCALSLAHVRGMLAGLGADPARATAAPGPSGCCVAVQLP